ncbi:MAG: AmmeMemoRadiSam system radical SAM enzyme [Pseudomonadota bacterium]
MEAFLYEKWEDQEVRCHLCSHRCMIKKGKRGICGVRENRSGRLETLVYGKIVAQNIDPIEKKPIFHLAPGSLSYSIATCGCNFSCRFCQNSEIAQMPSEQDGMIIGHDTLPEDIVEDALRNGCKTIAYTYTEPTVFFEFAFETARLAQKKGLKNIFVTNGYMTPEALDMIAPVLDAANVDLKAFNNEFYQKICHAKLEPVKNTLKKMKALGILVEVTTLLIPGLNDDTSELKRLAAFIAGDLGVETPWHISRFHPTYKMTDRDITSVNAIMQARQIGLDAGLRYVYSGNIHGDSGENTLCYHCGKILIRRHGYHIHDYQIKNSQCPYCRTTIDGIDL